MSHEDKLKKIWTKYLALNNADRKLCTLSQQLFLAICKKANNIDALGKIPKNLSGSSVDGAAIGRWFKKCGDVLIEWDIMYNIARIYCSCRGTVDEIPGNPGYVTVKSMDQKGNGSCIFHANDDAFKEVLNGNCNINGEAVKKDFKDHLEYILNHGGERKIQEAFNKILKGAGKVEISQEGVSILIEVHGNAVSFLCDNVASIFCQISWPERAKHWGELEDHKNMKLLTNEQMKKIQESGCHIVPKTIPTDDYAWRWSLSKAESAVIQHLSLQQHLAYLICKVLFYNKLSNKKGDSEDQVITSFIVKSAMYSVFASTGNAKRKYTDAQILVDVLPLVRLLLEYMKKALQSRDPYMKHFFLKGVNVLNRVTPKFGQEVAKELRNIIKGITDPAISVPCDIDSIIEKVHNIEVNAHEYKDEHNMKFKEKSEAFERVGRAPIADDILNKGIEKYKMFDKMFEQINTDKYQTMFFGDGTILEMYKGGFRVIDEPASSVKSTFEAIDEDATRLRESLGRQANFNNFKAALSQQPIHNLAGADVFNQLAEQLYRNEKTVKYEGVHFTRYSSPHSDPWFYSCQEKPDGDPIQTRGLSADAGFDEGMYDSVEEVPEARPEPCTVL